MLGKRVLVINKLVVAVPDEIVGKDGEFELSIDEILKWLLEYRKTANAVTRNNRVGNFVYFSCDCPYGCNPENPKEFNEQTMLDYLNETGPEKRVAGMMTALTYDEDLGSYRNCYLGDEEIEFEERKKSFLNERARMVQEAKDAADAAGSDGVDDDMPSCDHCDNICSEHCPDEPGVGEDADE